MVALLGFQLVGSVPGWGCGSMTGVTPGAVGLAEKLLAVIGAGTAAGVRPMAAPGDTAPAAS